MLIFADDAENTSLELCDLDDYVFIKLISSCLRTGCVAGSRSTSYTLVRIQSYLAASFQAACVYAVLIGAVDWHFVTTPTAASVSAVYRQRR